MRIMVYYLFWVMQDFVHQQYGIYHISAGVIVTLRWNPHVGRPTYPIS